MKLLLVTGSDETYNQISHYVKPLGFELIRYFQVQKAMDNIDEIEPSAIIISARDFPRHWKTMVQFVRSERSKEICPIIILKSSNFSQEETHKASFLGVSGIVTEALNNSNEIDRLQGILSRYLPVDEKRKNKRFHAEPWQRIGFVFIRPQDNILVTGELKTISTGGLSLLPDNPSLMKDLFLDMELKECSLRIGDVILEPICRVARTGRTVSMQFLSFAEGELEALKTYLESIPLMEVGSGDRK
ncbi:MAG: PilZ domain-containing protein [Treponema sp.]|nr:PilZ domain-containing protein [Treponema sp.]